MSRFFHFVLSFGAARFARFLFFLIKLGLSCQLLAFLEAIDISAGIKQFLLAREEWMAGAADFGIDFRNRRTGFKGVATGTGYYHVIVVLRMDSVFHLGEDLSALCLCSAGE